MPVIAERQVVEVDCGLGALAHGHAKAQATASQSSKAAPATMMSRAGTDMRNKDQLAGCPAEEKPLAAAACAP